MPWRRLVFALLAGALLSPGVATGDESLPAEPEPPTAQAEPEPQTRAGAVHAVPLYGELVRGWDAPHDDPFAPGHRGLDVAAPMGTPVRASAPGLVIFAGTVAGNRSVTVDHGAGLWTTYSFLDELLVAQAEQVSQGQPVGTVGRGHPGSELPAHVHLSARRDQVYIDPFGLYVGSSLADLLSLVG